MSMISKQVEELRGIAMDMRVLGSSYNGLGDEWEYIDAAADTIEVLSAKVRANNLHGGWIPVSERLPKKDEYVDDVCKYYLVQDEYGDMHVAHLHRTGWMSIEEIEALGCEVVAWMELPEKYGGGDHEQVD